MSASVVFLGVRFHLESGLRRAMKLWTALLVAVVVAAGLEVTLPIGSWFEAWAKAEVPQRAGIAAGLSAGVGLLLGSMLRQQLRVARRTTALLPLSPSRRLAIGAVVGALFTAPIGLVLLVMAPTVAESSVALSASLFPLWVACALLAAGRAGVLRSLAAAIAAAVVATLAAWGTPLGLLLALALLPVVAAAANPRRDRSEERRTADPVCRSLPTGRFPLSHELGWLARMGIGATFTGILLSLLPPVAASLAIRNNRVESVDSAIRIAFFFLPFGAAFIAIPLCEAWRRARPWRAIESLLPITGTKTVFRRSILSFAASLPMLSILILTWPFSTAAAIAPLTFALIVLLLTIAVGAIRSIDAPGEGAILWTAGLVAVTGAVSWQSGLLLSILAGAVACVALSRKIALADYPVPQGPEAE